MQYFGSMIVVFLWSFVLSAQDTAVRMQQLQRENDSLRLALIQCQQAPFQLIAGLVPAGQNPDNPTDQLQLLPKIQAISMERYKTAKRVLAETDSFVRFCEGLRRQLIALTETLDSASQSPQGMRNKAASNTLLVEGDQGIILKKRILSLRSVYTEALNGSSTPAIPLDIEADYRSSSADKKWVQYKFKNMPVAAVMPILGKYMADAESSAQAVLLYLSQE
jgi:hypothetical protein